MFVSGLFLNDIMGNIQILHDQVTMPLYCQFRWEANFRGVAQFGRAIRLGRIGPGFKSSYPDQFLYGSIMTSTNTNELTKVKLDLTFIDENGVAWFENTAIDFTADLPAKYEKDDRSFEITKDSETYWCFDDEVGYFVLSKTDHKVIFISVEPTEEGYEIQDVQIMHMKTVH